MNTEFKLPMTRPKWTKVQLIEDQPRTLSETSNYDAESQFFVDIPGGAEEYAIYGWFKPEKLNEYWTPLFRLTPNKNYGNLNNLGDRDMAAWINWPEMTVYPASSQYSPDNWNKYSWFNRQEEDLTDWFWMYMGYSYAKKRTVMFIRYNDHERQIIFDDQNKFIPLKLYVDIGQD